MTPPPATTVEGDAGRQVSHGKHGSNEFERVYIWDLLVRMSHWIIMICVFMLALTGVYIGDPFLIPAGAANEQFVMATMKVVHFYTAIIFTLTVASRIAWMFVGSYYAGWRQFVPMSSRRRRDVLGMLKFYLFLSKEPPMNVGHNPLAGSFYLLVFALYLVMIFTGFAMYSVSTTGYTQIWEFLVPMLGGLQMARWIHHLAMWFILGFVGHHIWSAMLVSRVEGMGLIDSLFSGYKFLPKGWRNRDD